jgi:DNA-binding MarR family transcriptional regulator
VLRQESTPDAARELLQGIQGLVRRFSVAERADVACCGVTVAQGAALAALLAEGPLRLGSLARNVERLEAAGLVRREPDEDDARSFRIRLTPEGGKAARALQRQEVAFARQVLERLPAERREAVSAAFRDLLVAVREATEGCCPGAFEHLMEGLPRGEDARGARAPRRGETCDEGCGGPLGACHDEEEILERKRTR